MSETKPLPRRAMLDTGVVIRALRQREDDQGCVEFWDLMLASKRKVLIAAPTWAEALRSHPDTQIPATTQIVVVPFDRQSAEILAAHIPMVTQKQLAKALSIPCGYFKYDAMIVSCAKRWKADVIVTLDADHRKLAKTIGVQCVSPSQYTSAQIPLPLHGKHDD